MRRHRMTRAVTGVLTICMAMGMTLEKAHADAAEQQVEVDRAQVTLESFAASKMGDGLKEAMKDAAGVLIVPQLLRAGFIWGGSGGSGVLLARQEDGLWSQPAFYGMGDVTFGLQAGAD